MTKLLQDAITRLANLPEPEQDAFASQILTTLDCERKWDALFRDSQEMFSEMAAEARDEDASFWLRASEGAMRKVWDNAEDDVYAELLK